MQGIARTGAARGQAQPGGYARAALLPIALLALPALSACSRRAEAGTDVVTVIAADPRAGLAAVIGTSRPAASAPSPSPTSALRRAEAEAGMRQFEEISRDIARRSIAAAKPIEKEKTIWID